MAEPLLKRTFSKLRGKDRSRRKTDPKLSGERAHLFTNICSNISTNIYTNMYISI